MRQRRGYQRKFRRPVRPRRRSADPPPGAGRCPPVVSSIGGPPRARHRTPTRPNAPRPDPRPAPVMHRAGAGPRPTVRANRVRVHRNRSPCVSLPRRVSAAAWPRSWRPPPAGFAHKTPIRRLHAHPGIRGLDEGLHQPGTIPVAGFEVRSHAPQCPSQYPRGEIPAGNARALQEPIQPHGTMPLAFPQRRISADPAIAGGQLQCRRRKPHPSSQPWAEPTRYRTCAPTSGPMPRGCSRVVSSFRSPGIRYPRPKPTPAPRDQ